MVRWKGNPMADLKALQEKAARAERLAWAVTDQKTTDALLNLARDYRTQAGELRAKLAH